jgi:hypothetical protein
MSRITDLESSIKTTIQAEGSIDALVVTFDTYTGGKDFSLTWESLAMTYGQHERPAVIVKLSEPPEPDRNTTNEELYSYPCEIYVIGQMNSSKAGAYTSTNAIVTLLEPLISKQKSSTYNFSTNAYSTGSQTEFIEINESNQHLCIAVIRTNIIKIFSY